MFQSTKAAYLRFPPVLHILQMCLRCHYVCKFISSSFLIFSTSCMFPIYDHYFKYMIWWTFFQNRWAFFKICDLFRIDELFLKLMKFFSKLMNSFSKPMNSFHNPWTFFSKWMNSFSKLMNCFSKLMTFFKILWSYFKIDELFPNLMNFFQFLWTFFQIWWFEKWM